MGRRIYVKVTAAFDALGAVTPLTVQKPEEEPVVIRRVVESRRAVGGRTGYRFTVAMQETAEQLYFDGSRWFVKERV